MKYKFLTVALLAASTVGFSGCATNFKASHNAPVTAKASASHSGWSYSGDTAPANWGNVKGASTCAIGQEQSPIDIKTVVATAKTAPAFNYTKTVNLNVKDNGHTIVFTPDNADSTIVLNNEGYALKQFHYHTPSEHQFTSQHYPAEVHFVHANSEGKLAVIGVMLKTGQENETKTFKTMLSGAKVSADQAAKAKINTGIMINNMDLSTLIPDVATFYHYQGSLTTPPCSEQVQWYVAKEAVEISPAQMAVLSGLYEGNNRPVQPHGARIIEQVIK